MVNFCNQAKGKLVDLKECIARIWIYLTSMRIVIQRIGLYLAVAGILIWLIGGARKGPYVISEEIEMIDLVTEQDYSERHPKFIPGIEPLFLGIILGGSFFLLSFLFSRPLTQISNSQL
mgnify:FL=1